MNENPKLLQDFYRNHYPWKEIFSHIISDMQTEETRVEIAINVVEKTQGKLFGNRAKRKLSVRDRYIRYLSASSASEFGNLIKTHNYGNKSILSLHFGGLHVGYPLPSLPESLPAHEICSNSFSRVDIDLNEFKRLREGCCGSLKKHCPRCWVAAVCSMEQIMFVAHFVLGISKSDVLFFYSGNKGIHSVILGLPHETFYKTLAIVKYSLQRSISYCIWDDVSRRLSNILLEYAKQLDPQITDPKLSTELLFIQSDEAVSKQQLHLLKSPFSVHPSTLKFCCYIPWDSIHTFDPDAVPRLEVHQSSFFGEYVRENVKALLQRKNEQQIQ